MPAEQTASSVKSQDAIALLIADHKKVQKMFKDFEKLEQRMGVLQLRPCISSRQKSRGCGEVGQGKPNVGFAVFTDPRGIRSKPGSDASCPLNQGLT